MNIMPISSTPAVGGAGVNRTGTSGYDIIRVLLGVVLLAAGLLKGYELAMGPVAGLGFLASRGILIGLVEFELVFGLWLLTGLYPRKTWCLAVACFAAFGVMALLRALAGEASCGCFGRVTVNPWVTFALDAAAVAALLHWGPMAESAPTFRSHYSRAIGFLIASVLFGIPAAVAISRPTLITLTARGTVLGEGDLVILKPATWVGKRFPLLDYIDIGDELAAGRFTVVLYHHDCPSCQVAIPEYERRAYDVMKNPEAPRIALIEMPPHARAGESLISSNSPCVVGRLDESRRWFITTPAEIVLVDAIVQPKENDR